MWAAGPNDVYSSGGALGSGGEGLLVHFDGSAWSTIPLGTTATLWWVFGLGPRDVYLVGEQGTILHWDGSAVTSMTSGTASTLYGIWGTGADDLWSVGGRPGQDGVLLHKDASGWQVLPSPVPFVAFFKIWGVAANDIFLCGEGGTIVHYDGAAWTVQPTGLSSTTTLFTIAGRSHGEVYSVGGFGKAVAMRYDGAAWSPMPDALLANTGSLAGVSVDPHDGTLILVGEGGIKLRGKPGALVDESAEAPHDDLHSAFYLDGELYTVGGNYLAPTGAARHGVIGHYGR